MYMHVSFRATCSGMCHVRKAPKWPLSCNTVSLWEVTPNSKLVEQSGYCN